MVKHPMIVMSCRQIAGLIAAQGAQVTYLQALRAVGAQPVLLPIGSSDDAITRIVELADGVLLPGGEDISPQMGGSLWTGAKAQRNDVARDELELKLVGVARSVKKPILGICRGLQLLNVAYGGSLIADIDDENRSALTHMGALPSHSEAERGRSLFGATHHRVHILTGSWLHQVFGETELEVNSFHHQAIDPKNVGEGLRPCAWASDGTIEAIEASDMNHFVAAAQWHPEMLEYFGVDGWKAFFQHFVDVCRD